MSRPILSSLFLPNFQNYKNPELNIHLGVWTSSHKRHFMIYFSKFLSIWRDLKVSRLRGDKTQQDHSFPFSTSKKHRNARIQMKVFKWIAEFQDINKHFMNIYILSFNKIWEKRARTQQGPSFPVSTNKKHRNARPQMKISNWVLEFQGIKCISWIPTSFHLKISEHMKWS